MHRRATIESDDNEHIHRSLEKREYDRMSIVHYSIFQETPNVPFLVRLLVEKRESFDKIKYQIDEHSFHERE